MKSRTILITGAALRLGREIALSFNQDTRLILHYNHSHEEAISLQKELEASGIKTEIYQANFSDLDSISKFEAWIKSKYSQIDILINNASCFEKNEPGSADCLKSVLNINLNAPLLLSEMVAKIMPKKSSIINIIDHSAIKPFKDYGYHSISKAALMHATKVLAKQLSPNIRVNNLLLGAILPDRNISEAEVDKLVNKHCLLKRVGRKKEVIHAVHFLIDNEYINDSTLSLDGGQA